MNKFDSAKAAVLERLAGIEEAVGDWRPGCGITERLSVVETAKFERQLTNRVMTVAVSIRHLEDTAWRLLKRLGHSKQDFDRVLATSKAIRITRDLADTWKHGLGGKQGNSTLLNGVIQVRRQDRFPDAEGHERVHVIGMVVVDSKIGGTTASGDLFGAAVRAWGKLLTPHVPEAADWVKRICPAPQGPVVPIPQGQHIDVPLGSTVVGAIPQEIVDTLTEDAKRRRDLA